MIHIDFDPTDPTRLNDEQKEWWRRWEKRATTAIAAAIKAAGRPAKPTAPAKKKQEPKKKPGAKPAKEGAVDFNQKIWKDLKDWLLKNVFHGKCAYCETQFVGGFYGDAEHYRPKGEVRVGS
jgi:hypothetical protein